MMYPMGMDILRKCVLIIFWSIMALPVLPALPFIALLCWADKTEPQSKRRIRAQQASRKLRAQGQNWL